MDTLNTSTAVTGRDIRRLYRAALLVATLACLAPPRLAVAQAPTPSVATVAPTLVGPGDEFGRGVPRTSVRRGFLEACWVPNTERAANYLDLRRLPPPTRAKEGPGLASQLCTVLDRAIWVDPEQLSDAPDGERSCPWPGAPQRSSWPSLASL